MDPYASPREKKIGANRPKIRHLVQDAAQPRTRADREAEKRAVAAERRAIKKSARRYLKTELQRDLSDSV